MDDTSNHEPSRILRRKAVRVIAGKSLDEWREFARRDDCLDQMVPSDLRQLIGAIPNAE
mgnify:CR=1 FL=1